MTTTPESWRERQSRVLTELRTASGLKPDDVARRAGLTYSRYTRFESGETSMPAEWLPSLAHAFGISRSALAYELGLIEPPVDLRDLLEAENVPDERIKQLEKSIGRAPTTPALLQLIARLAGEAIRQGDTDSEQHRRRA